MMSTKKSVLDDQFSGKLYYLEEEETYIARIRFDYQKVVLRELNEGEFILVENFLSEPDLPVYSVLKVISIFPKHYALEAVRGTGYPGFLKDVMTNIVEDWILEESAETYVDCQALPMGYDVVIDTNKGEIKEVIKRSSKPIPGKKIFLFNSEALEIFMSWGMTKDESLNLGKSIQNENISIYINLNKMVRRHFGVFASTGSGKSNFLAQLIRQTLQDYTKKTGQGIKIIVFDIQGEYLTLLADILYESGLLVMGEDDIFPKLESYYQDTSDKSIISDCAEILSRSVKKPGILEKRSDLFIPIFKKILERGRIKTVIGDSVSAPTTVEAFIEEISPRGDARWEHRVFEALSIQLKTKHLAGDLTDDKFELLKEKKNLP